MSLSVLSLSSEDRSRAECERTHYIQSCERDSGSTSASKSNMAWVHSFSFPRLMRRNSAALISGGQEVTQQIR